MARRACWILAAAAWVILGAGCGKRGLQHVPPIAMCTPRCLDRDCGDDDCGGSCGECTGDRACHTGTGLCVGGSEDIATGRVRLEYRPFEVDPRDGVSLGDPRLLGAWRLNVTVADEDGTVLGQSHADREGRFGVRTSRKLTGRERLVFTSLWAPEGRVLLAVLQAGEGGLESANRLPWSWTAPVTPGKDADVVVSEADGSGAMFVFLMAQFGLQTVREAVQRTDGTDDVVPLALVWSPGVSWDCGACFASFLRQTLSPGGEILMQSIFLPGVDAGAWGWAVDFHEFGHYVASNYSQDDSPGGPHGIGQKLPPPFAWSEGWASFVSIFTASGFFETPLPIYWDIQGGTTFWIDYESRMVQPWGEAVVAPSPKAGIAQDLDESFVTSILWGMWDQDTSQEAVEPPADRLSRYGILAAATGERFHLSDRGAAGADLVDFLDAAVCDRPDDASALVARVREQAFPYDGKPACGAQGELHRPGPPVQVLRTGRGAEVEAVDGLAAPLRVRWEEQGRESSRDLAGLRRGERFVAGPADAGTTVRVDVSLPGGRELHLVSRPRPVVPGVVPMPAVVAIPPVRTQGATVTSAIPVSP